MAIFVANPYFPCQIVCEVIKKGMTMTSSKYRKGTSGEEAVFGIIAAAAFALFADIDWGLNGY